MTTKAQIEGLGAFANFGFTLEHPDDHVVELYHEGECIARYSQRGATQESLKEGCALHLVNEHGWDGCLWSRTEANHGDS